MKDLKLEHHHLKYYLGTGLELELGGYNNPKIGFMNGINTRNNRVIYTAHSGMIEDDIKIHFCKPIMYRLSDLDKFIPELGIDPIDIIWRLNLGHTDWVSVERTQTIQDFGFERWFFNIPFGILQKLFEWNFWVFGDEYFDEGLIIDKLKEI